MEILIAIIALLPFIGLSHKFLNHGLKGLISDQVIIVLSLPLSFGLVSILMFILGIFNLFKPMILWVIIGILYFVIIFFYNNYRSQSILNIVKNLPEIYGDSGYKKRFTCPSFNSTFAFYNNHTIKASFSETNN